MAACRPIRVEISAFSTPECAIKSKSAEYDGARIILYLPQESNDNQKVFFARVASLPIIDAYSLKLNQPRIYPFTGVFKEFATFYSKALTIKLQTL